MDADMFVINELSVNHYLQAYDVTAMSGYGSPGEIVFLPPRVMFLNIDSLPDKDAAGYK
jgi:hypothetical protein